MIKRYPTGKLSMPKLPDLDIMRKKKQYKKLTHQRVFHDHL